MKPNDQPPSPSPAPRSSIIPLLLVLAVAIFVSAIRYRLLDMPLERDEGEYAYAGQLILEGVPPYSQAYNMKLPGTYLAYAAIMAVFGQTGQGVHWGLIFVNSAAIFLVYFLGKRLLDSTTGLVAAAAFGVMSIGKEFLGLAAHATHFVTLAMLVGMHFFLNAREKGRRPAYFLAGLFFGIAFLMKQQGVFFGVFGGAWILWEEWSKPKRDWHLMGERISVYSMGCLLPFVLVCAWLWLAGVFEAFWFWTFKYAREYVTGVDLRDGLELFRQRFMANLFQHGGFMVLGLVGFVMMWWRRPMRGRDTFLTAFAVFSFLTACPGMYFREHYFIPMLPAAAVFVGLAVSLLSRRLSSRETSSCHPAPVLAAVAALVMTVWVQREVFFTLPIATAVRVIYNVNPFPEAVEIARYLRENTPKDAKIVIMGSEPQIYFYARRRSATGFLYTYSLVEYQPFALGLQKRMADEVEKGKPEYLIYVNVPFSWLADDRAPQDIFKWLDDYCAKYYHMIGLVDMVSGDNIGYYWGEAAKRLPSSKYHILILQRNPES